MKLRPLAVVALGLGLIGSTAWIVHHIRDQQDELLTLHQHLQALETQESKVAGGHSSESAAHSKAPSAELLKARAAVAALRDRAGGDAAPRLHANRADSTSVQDDLHRLMKGRLPSNQPDFVAAAGVRNLGFGTPENALETFWWHFAASGRADSETFEKLWWSPEGAAPDGYHFEIGLGMGVGAFTGYRVSGRDNVSADEVVFHLEREERGSVVEEDALFIRIGDHWVRKPVVRLVKNDK